MEGGAEVGSGFDGGSSDGVGVVDGAKDVGDPGSVGDILDGAPADGGAVDGVRGAFIGGSVVNGCVGDTIAIGAAVTATATTSIDPVIPAPQCGLHLKKNVPGWEKTWCTTCPSVVLPKLGLAREVQPPKPPPRDPVWTTLCVNPGEKQTF